MRTDLSEERGFFAEVFVLKRELPRGRVVFSIELWSGRTEMTRQGEGHGGGMGAPLSGGLSGYAPGTGSPVALAIRHGSAQNGPMDDGAGERRFGKESSPMITTPRKSCFFWLPVLLVSTLASPAATRAASAR